MATVTIPDLWLILHAESSAPLSQHYKYTVLPTEGWIRILVLHPGTASDGLSCSLIAREIQDVAASGFEALSYVWGSNDICAETREIDCGGHIMRIRENLACALSHLRHENEARFLWVDALCINQGDKEERSTQVQQMGEIYKSAHRVLVWIGPDCNNEAHECFSLVQDTTTILMNMILKHGDVSLIPPIDRESGQICSDRKKWDMVRRLTDSEWFERLWVLQEVGLARSAVLLYGGSSLNWAYLVELMLIVASRADIASHVGNIKSGMFWDFYEDLWKSFGNPVSWRNELPLTKSLNNIENQASFINILNDGRAYKATDQRDRVYAFLSHPSAACDFSTEVRLVVADYNLSVDQVYLDTAKRILENDPYPWTVLTCVDHALDSPSLSNQRPSWVPRWDEGWRMYWLGYPEMWYRAGGTQRAAFQFEVSEVESTLSLRGVILDSIAWTSRSFDANELRLEPQKDKLPLQLLWQELQKNDRDNAIYSRSVEDREYAFSLVVIAGRAADEGPAEEDPSHHRAVYQAYKVMVGTSDFGQEEDTSTEEPYADQQEKEDYRKSIELEALTYIGSQQRRALHNRRFFRTAKGYYGIAHRAVEVGDLCCVFRGANVPFVIREAPVNNERETPTRTSDQYTLVGEAYVQGIMRGELFQSEDESSHSGLVEQSIIIV